MSVQGAFVLGFCTPIILVAAFWATDTLLNRWAKR